MSVTMDDVKKVALLARLELDEAATERMTRDMNAILAHVEKLSRSPRLRSGQALVGGRRGIEVPRCARDSSLA